MIEQQSLNTLFTDTRMLLAQASVQDVSVPVSFLNELSSLRSKNALLETYARWARKISKADRCSIALHDGADKVVNHTLNGDFDVGKGIEHDIDDTVIGEVLTRQQMIYLPNLADIDRPDAQEVHQMGYHAAILSPIVNGAKSVGTLTITYRSRPEQLPVQLSLISTMAQCLATQFLIIEQMDRLQEMAHTDPLTGAKNRYSLYDQAQSVWSDWIDDKTAFCYIAVDIDHFKEVNDTYGHDVGDQVLCTMVKRLSARTRQSDPVIRSGGEEFGLLLPQTTLDQATARAIRLCNAIGDNRFYVLDLELQITASFGVTQVRPRDMNFAEVLKRADQALYAAKARGRDQVVTDNDADLAA